MNSGRIVIHAGRALFARGVDVAENLTLLIEDGRIAAIEDGFQNLPADHMIDARRATVLPGLIDAHCHIAFERRPQPPVARLVTRSVADLAIAGVVNAGRTLRAGFTTIRNLGATGRTDLALARAIDEGAIPGPRIWPALEYLGPTGGHSDQRNGLDDFIDKPAWDAYLIDGVDSAIRMVRRHHRRGARVIKIMPSGGVGTEGDDPNHLLMTEAEIRAVCETAHALGLKVAAHAHGRDPIMVSTLAGVDSIEHGSFADEACLAAMKERGTFLVPTMRIGVLVAEASARSPESFAPGVAQKAAAMPEAVRSCVAMAHRMGVKLVCGTDCTGLFRHGDNADEIITMSGAGLAPLDALRAATMTAADLIGDTRIGRLAVGAHADIAIPAGDPLADIRALKTMAHVIKAGRIIPLEGEA